MSGTSELKIKEFDTLQKIVDQLERCEYECEAGVLTNNVAFISLKRMAKSQSLLTESVFKCDKDLDDRYRPIRHAVETIRLLWNGQPRQGLSEMQRSMWAEAVRALLNAVKPFYKGLDYNHIVED